MYDCIINKYSPDSVPVGSINTSRAPALHRGLHPSTARFHVD